ncbi:uncharacterized protein [Diadema antillarum]|uniref:uncharacterized protein n=1 Tax=Diadema antillarum TaxID=105358 RepID=UPI003A8834F8
MGYSCNGILLAVLVVLVTWNTQLRCSRAQVLECSDPGTPDNGNRSRDGDFRVDSTVTFQCDAGLELNGSAVIVCINTAEGVVWNDTTPSCVETSSPEQSTKSSTSSDIVTILPTSLPGPPPSIGRGGLIGGVCGGLLVIVLFITLIMALCCMRQKRKSLNITPPPPLRLPPSGDSKVELTITKDSDEEDGDYLVPNVPFQDVDNRPRLPAPTSVKAPGSYVAVAVKRGESVYQNAPAIILSRSRENVNKAVVEDGKKARSEPAYQNAEAVQPLRDSLKPVPDNAKDREGSAQDDADQIYENSVVASHTGSLAGGRLPRSPAGRKGSADVVSAVSRVAPARKTTPGNFCVSMTPSDDVTKDNAKEEEQEVYENAGVIRAAGPSPRCRRPPGRSSLTPPDPVHASDYGADYIEIISDK